MGEKVIAFWLKHTYLYCQADTFALLNGDNEQRAPQ